MQWLMELLCSMNGWHRAGSSALVNERVDGERVLACTRCRKVVASWDKVLGPPTHKYDTRTAN